MARKKSQQLQDLSTQVLNSLQNSTEINGEEYSVDTTGAIHFKINGEVFRAKISKINGPRSKKTEDTEMSLS